MHDSFRVSGVERVRNFDGEREHHFQIQRPAGDAVLERHAIQEFHGDESLSILLADVVNGADVWMIEGGRRLSLALETPERLRIASYFIGEEFESDEASEASVFRFINHPHAPAPKSFNDAVVRNCLADHWAEILGPESRQVNEGPGHVACHHLSMASRRLRLSPPATTATAAWNEKIVYTFKGGSDGSEPGTGVILDKRGNVYGTTTFGGSGGNNGGIAFELTAANSYAKTVLHNFNRVTDPAEDYPNGLTFDASGNLWGLTEYALFKLSPGPSGWTESFVFNWQNTAGWSFGFTPLIVDSHGVLWGTDTWGGLAFKIAP